MNPARHLHAITIDSAFESSSAQMYWLLSFFLYPPLPRRSSPCLFPHEGLNESLLELLPNSKLSFVHLSEGTRMRLGTEPSGRDSVPRIRVELLGAAWSVFLTKG